ncbi:MAG: type III restriction-modification system endonuclease [Erysipelotrichaceae bacterium]
MELILEKELVHQQKAVDALRTTFSGVKIRKPIMPIENPLIDVSDTKLKSNIADLQKNIYSEYRGCRDDGSHISIDIKMETGTGKTYVYTNTIYELNKEYGFNKFIIAVPSLAIKAGTKQFMTDSYVKKHFSDVCGYNRNIELSVLESPKKQKKGLLAMPSAVRNFVMGSCQNSNKIYVLLVNMQLLTSGKMLTRDDYDYLVEGFYRPFDALKATKPIVFIDEPHRFSREQRAFTSIVNEITPQAIIRFGATFPEVSIGTGRNKKMYKDYNNLIYDLNACDSFNNNLIKGICKEHFEPTSEKEEKVKLTTIVSKTSATFNLKKRGTEDKIFTLVVGDSLSSIDSSFEGIRIEAIGKDFIELSNGQTKYKGEEFNTDIYSSSYQEQMIKLAIERHFETERQNFCSRKFRIKTLALFFIDDITSYRNDADSTKEPYLKMIFEKLLLDKIEQLLLELPSNEIKYREYLQASKDDIAACHAGYFAQDNSNSDEAIATEVYDILHNKKQLLSLYNSDGTFNTRRFLFSKWTLKEGWDNPNVFTIAKLRSSGSENSKLQEVGRGLRLPIDENGNRISNEEFRLNYIVDFTEADFANKLVDEINGEIPINSTITLEDLDNVAKKLNMDPDVLFVDLLSKRYVNRNNEIRSESREAFFAEYPDFAKGIESGRVTDTNKKPQRTVKIRKAQFEELKLLWNTINQKYYLLYDADLNNEIPKVLNAILHLEVFGNMILSSQRSNVVSDGATMYTEDSTGVQYVIEKKLSYKNFLISISKQTSIPISLIHNEMIKLSKETTINENHLNEYTVANIVQQFRNWKISATQGRFKYCKSTQVINETVLTYADGTPRDTIVQGKIGIKFSEGTPCDKYLYDAIAFDSPLEKDNIVTDGIDEVIVYGKIPRSSVAIPTIVGETYSPDFMYVVKKKDGTKELNIIIETKMVENQQTLRGIEDAKIKCAEIFFEQLKIEGYEVTFKTQLNNKKVKNILEEVLA